MRTLMSGAARVHYGQIYVQSGEAFPDLAECFAGQSNGLCGSAMGGILFLITGLHTGEVGFTVELHEEPPPVDGGWQEIVETSFRPLGEAGLAGWGGEQYWPLDLAEVGYRVRYCATGMDEARELDTRTREEPEVDHYVLQFWPAPPAPDTVIKQTSRCAAYWHQFVRQQPPPLAEKATARERARAEQPQTLERVRQARRAAVEEAQWGGRLPSPRLLELGGHVRSVARLDRSLVEAIGEADPLTQRKIACWVTRRAFAEARLSDIDWIASALEAMDRGAPLPSPFDGDDKQAWDRLFSDERVPRTVVTSPDGRHDNLLQQAGAFPALFSAREQDSLRAALDALWSAAVAFGFGRRQVLFNELRQAFPALAASPP